MKASNFLQHATRELRIFLEDKMNEQPTTSKYIISTSTSEETIKKSPLFGLWKAPTSISLQLLSFKKCAITQPRERRSRERIDEGKIMTESVWGPDRYQVTYLLHLPMLSEESGQSAAGSMVRIFFDHQRFEVVIDEQSESIRLVEFSIFEESTILSNPSQNQSSSTPYKLIIEVAVDTGTIVQSDQRVEKRVIHTNPFH